MSHNNEMDSKPKLDKRESQWKTDCFHYYSQVVQTNMCDEQDKQSHEAGYQLTKLTQSFLIRSHERGGAGSM